MECFHTFPVHHQGFQVHALCQAATNDCHLTHGYGLDHRKNVFPNPRSTHESQTPHRGIHHFATPSATGEVPVLISTGHLLQERKKNWNADADLQAGRQP